MNIPNSSSLPFPISLNGHELELVMPLLPSISRSVLSVFSSRRSPNTMFFCKLYSNGVDGSEVTFTFFEVTKSRIERLLTSGIGVNALEKGAHAVYQVEFSGKSPIEGLDDLEEVFSKFLPGEVDVEYEVLGADIVAMRENLYAVDGAGTYNDLLVGLGILAR